MNAIPLLILYMVHKMAGGAGPSWPDPHSPPPRRAKPRRERTPAEQAHHANEHGETAPKADMQVGPVETIKHGEVTHREPVAYGAPSGKVKRRRGRKPPPQITAENWQAPFGAGATEHHDKHAAHPAHAQPKPAADHVESHQAPPAPSRSAEQAAQDLYDYVTARTHKNLGTKNAPSETVRACQRDMGTTPDGVYGPNDRARGKMLIGKSFPPRTAVAGRAMYIP